MKKWMILLATFLLLFLGACSNQANEEVVKEEPKEETTPVEETKPEPKPEEKPEAPADEEPEEPKEEPKDNNNDSTIDLLSYLTDVGSYLTDMSNYMFEFSDLNTAAGGDESLLTDEAWLAEMERILADMAGTIESVRGMDVPPKAEEVHNLILLAMDEFDFVVINYPVAIENQDADMLFECVDALLAGADFLQQASSAMTELDI